jgi:hypothetical protein
MARRTILSVSLLLGLVGYNSGTLSDGAGGGTTGGTTATSPWSPPATA